MNAVIARHLNTGSTAWRNMNGALMEFQGALERRDFEAASKAQLIASANFESYMDSMLAATKEIAATEHKP